MNPDQIAPFGEQSDLSPVTGRKRIKKLEKISLYLYETSSLLFFKN